ncbi:hypothetical protein EC991_002922 [Linnemannia zychae]|nr:hypothetical protein EC991_002922 [Linnemannia zychae]
MALIDLRLGSLTWKNDYVPKIDHVIGSLSRLQVLHRYNLNSKPNCSVRNGASPYGSVALRELVEFGLHFYAATGLLEAAIQRSLATIEVLVLNIRAFVYPILSLSYYNGLSSSIIEDCQLPFSRLTHLELPLTVSTDTFELMTSVLPELALTHFDVHEQIGGLLASVNLAFLLSLCIGSASEDILGPLYHSILMTSDCQIESLRLIAVTWSESLSEFLGSWPLKRLSISHMGQPHLEDILIHLNLTQLQVLTICDQGYEWNSEGILAVRSEELADEFVLQLGYKKNEAKRDVYDVDSRELQRTQMRLARHRVHITEHSELVREYYSSVLPSSSR